MKKQKQVGMWIGIDEAVGKKYSCRRLPTCLISPYTNRKQASYPFNIAQSFRKYLMRMSIPQPEMSYRDISTCIDDAIIVNKHLVFIEEGFA